MNKAKISDISETRIGLVSAISGVVIEVNIDDNFKMNFKLLSFYHFGVS